MADAESEDLVITPLLCVGGQSTRMGTRKELLSFPDGHLAFEHAIDSIGSVFPTADVIYISLHDETQLEGIRFCLECLATQNSHPVEPADVEYDGHHDHESSKVLDLKPIFDVLEYGDIGPAAGLLAAHAAQPGSTFLVLGCDYPLLPPSGIQQLLLEYEPPLTCFLNSEGISEPLIAIWSPVALEMLKGNVEKGMSGLNRVVKMMRRGGGEEVKMIRPLRDEWITGCNTTEEWEKAMQVIRYRTG